MSQAILALVRDREGALDRLVGLLRRRRYGLESLAVGPSERPGTHRVTLYVGARDVRQVVEQIRRLVDVVEASALSHEGRLERETALVRLHAPPAARAQVAALCSLCDARVVDVGARSVVVEITEAPAALDRFLELARAFGIEELTRTGRIAMVRPPVADEDAARPLAG